MSAADTAAEMGGLEAFNDALLRLLAATSHIALNTYTGKEWAGFAEDQRAATRDLYEAHTRIVLQSVDVALGKIGEAFEEADPVPDGLADRVITALNEPEWAAAGNAFEVQS